MFRNSSLLVILGVILVLVMIIVNLVVKKPDKGTTVVPSPPEREFSVLASIPSWDQERALSSFRQNAEKIDEVSFFWYYVDEAGNVQTYRNANEDITVIDEAHQKGANAHAIITNLADHDDGQEQWDAERVNAVIRTDQDRKRHAADLVSLAERMDFDGISIDYELLPASQREDFSLFIQELGQALHKKGKKLGVAIHGRTSDMEMSDGAAAQDLPVIAEASDYLYFMTYLEHVESSPPGPPGSLEWTEQVLRYAMDQGVPPEKISLGIGLFGIEWQGNEDGSYSGINNDLTYEDVQSLLQQHGVTPIWDERAGSNYFQFFEPDGRPHVVWYDDAKSVRERIAMAKRLDLGGVFFWRLGGEDPGMWSNF